MQNEHDRDDQPSTSLKFPKIEPGQQRYLLDLREAAAEDPRAEQALFEARIASSSGDRPSRP